MKRIFRSSAKPRGIRAVWVSAAVLALCMVAPAVPAAEQYFAGDGSALSASKYSTANGSPTGPFTTAFASGNVFGYGNTTAGTGTGASITVGGFDFTQSFTLTAGSGTTITNASNGVVTVSVASGITADFSTQAFTTSSTAGYTLTGGGTFATAGGTYSGGFTLSGGSILVARGVTAMGGSATNTLTINNGTIAGSASRDFTGKFGGGITINGNLTLGSSVAPASNSANLTFSDAVNLGSAATHTINVGGSGSYIFGGAISGTIGLIVSGTGSGTLTLSGANLFSGGLVAQGAEVDVTTDASLGATGGSLTINGGRIGFAASFTVDPTRNFFLGANPTGGNKTGTISIGTGFTTTINQGFQDLSGSKGDLVKQGGGMLVLGGQSTYTGNTFLSNGTTKITVNNALPTTTTLALGQAASTNTGTFDLNGFNQQVVGLNSTNSTTSMPVTKNTLTASTAGTLTLSGTGTYAYGDGSTTNSGVITGAVSILKTGTGTQTFGDNNTYTGSTTVNAGTLIVSGSLNGNGITVNVNNTGALTLTNATALNDYATLNLFTGSTLNLNNPTGGSETIGLLNLDGTAYGPGTYSVATLAMDDPNISFNASNGETLTVTGVPEPATVFGGLLMVGLLGWNQRRRLRLAVVGSRV